MQPFPRWVSWIFVCLLAYIIYIGNQAQRPPESAPQEAATTEAVTATPKEYGSLRRLVDGERWYRAINPNYVGDADIRELTEGEGQSVTCGGEVEVLLRGTDANGANFNAEHNEQKPLKFTVGDAPIEALNEGLIGMKQGGTRQLHAPAKFVYKDIEKRNFSEITFHLTLVKYTSPKDSDMSAIAVTTAEGSDALEPMRCGASMRGQITVFNASGARLAHTEEPVTFTLGKRELAQGVDALARGMRLNEARLLTIPAYYLQQAAKADASLSAIRSALRGNEARFVSITRIE